MLCLHGETYVHKIYDDRDRGEREDDKEDDNETCFFHNTLDLGSDVVHDEVCNCNCIQALVSTFYDDCRAP